MRLWPMIWKINQLPRMGVFQVRARRSIGMVVGSGGDQRVHQGGIGGCSAARGHKPNHLVA